MGYHTYNSRCSNIQSVVVVVEGSGQRLNCWCTGLSVQAGVPGTSRGDALDLVGYRAAKRLVGFVPQAKTFLICLVYCRFRPLTPLDLLGLA